MPKNPAKKASLKRSAISDQLSVSAEPEKQEIPEVPDNPECPENPEVPESPEEWEDLAALDGAEVAVPEEKPVPEDPAAGTRAGN